MIIKGVCYLLGNELVLEVETRLQAARTGRDSLISPFNLHLDIHKRLLLKAACRTHLKVGKVQAWLMQ